MLALLALLGLFIVVALFRLLILLGLLVASMPLMGLLALLIFFALMELLGLSTSTGNASSVMEQVQTENSNRIAYYIIQSYFPISVNVYFIN